MKVIGKVIDAHGIKGELKIKLLSSETDWHAQFKEVSLEGEIYEVVNLKPNKLFWILKLKGVEDRNKAETLKGKTLEANKMLFTTEEGEEPYLSELQGFSVDLEGKTVGQVESFKETMAHFLIVIKNENGFFEIPYVDAFIKRIDRSSKILFMSFPEDLLSDEFKLSES